MSGKQDGGEKKKIPAQQMEVEVEKGKDKGGRLVPVPVLVSLREAGEFWQDGKECRRLATPQRAAALDPALLHTSLADMPSQALFTWGCALLGTSEKIKNEVQ